MSTIFGDARLNMNQIAYFPWKGKTFTQITSSLKQNLNKNQFSGSIRNMFLANPLKLYRREIASTASSCSSRTGISIDEFNRPGGSIINTSVNNPNGLVNTIDNLLPNNTCEEPGTCIVVLSPAENARKRCRSSGMIPKKNKFDTSRNNDQYYTSTNQYLVSRNRTFQQNQYNFIRQGNSTAKPGDSLSVANIYSPNGINHCQKYFISDNTSFKYKWLNDVEVTVPILQGFYAVEEINAILQQTMITNNHYYAVDTEHNINQDIVFQNNYVYNQNKVFLLNIGYNNNTNQVELQVFISNSTIFYSGAYMVPNGAFPNPTPTTLSPQFIIQNNIFQQAIGFNAASYPATTTTLTANQTYLSTFAPGLNPLYVKLYYKPNNSQFGQQGAVSSSSLINRVKYDTLNTIASQTRNTYGNATANALAYGVSEQSYTQKTRVGYPMKSTPIISKYGDVTCQTIPKVKHF
jgi:hypothetical protein